MKKAWRVAGLVMALMGASTLVDAGQEKQCEEGGQGGKGGKGGQGGQPGRERPSREEMMKRFDADGDGQLSEEDRAALREEMGRQDGGQPGGERPSREEMMKRFDADGDGQLSEEERVALQEAFEARRRGRRQQSEQE